MIRSMKKILCWVLAIGVLLSCVACGKKKLSNVVSVTDNEALLTNPGMGWNFTYYANTIYDFNTFLKAEDYLDAYPCDIVFFRIGWNWIEPKEGEFNWDFTDEIAEKWISKGKRIAFCWAVAFPGDQSTPLWVKDAGAQGFEYTWDRKIVSAEGGTIEYDLTDPAYYYTAGSRNLGLKFENMPLDTQEWILNKGIRHDPTYNGGQEVEVGDLGNYRGSWIPYYDDVVFLEKWENFLKAAGERYDNNESVEFIEVGSFGDWGEGHASYSWENPITREIKTAHVDLYKKYFKNVQLFINDDVVGDNAYLVEYTKERNFGVSDHSVQVPNVGGNSEGRVGNASVTAQYYRDRPVLLENHNSTQIMENYYNSVNSCHASYARINCNPYMAIQSAWTNKITLRLGYRLTFTEFAFGDVVAGENLKIEYKIKNTGAAPCYGGGNPTFYLIDSLGRVKTKVVSSLDVKDLKVASSAAKAQETTGKASLKIPKNLLPGEYYLVVSVTKDGEDYYNLPLDNRDGNRKRYQIATFEVV